MIGMGEDREPQLKENVMTSCYEGPHDTCGYHNQPLIEQRRPTQIHNQPDRVLLVCPVTGAPIKVRI
jgi:hypothetical protein